VLVVGGAAFAARWFNVNGDASAEDALSVKQALALARAGDIHLIDIRRPDEWSRTGVASPAIPIDMRRADFAAVLTSVLATKGQRPVALICARGVRSNRLRTRLMNAGLTNIIDVPEGMLGSGAGPGWLKSGLPLRAPSASERAGQPLA